jgi:hypothetical protein
MKKAILLLSLIVMSASCFVFSRLDLSGNWMGTITNQYGTQRLDASLIQNGDNLSGTWSTGWGSGGDLSGTISGKTIRGSLSGAWGYSATINGIVTSDGKQITGSGTSQDGPFTFQLRKI